MIIRQNILTFFAVIVFLFTSFTLYAQSAIETNQSSEFSEQLKKEPIKQEGRPRVALVLSGGGARGFAHIPVIELLNSVGIPIDMIIGTSAGSIVGGLYCAGYTTDQLKSMLLNLDWSSIFEDTTVSPFEHRLEEHSQETTPFVLSFGEIDGNLSIQMGPGILTGQYTYELFKRFTLKLPSDLNFNDLPIPFRAVSVNLLTGDVEVFSHGDIAEAIRSSISIPAFFQPFYIDGKYYIDGGTRDNTPIDIAKKMGYDIIIVSEISDKLDNNIEKFESTPLTALIQMMNMEQAVRNRDEYKKADIILYPDYGTHTILDFDAAQDIYNSSKKSLPKYKPELEQLKRRIDSETTRTQPERKTRFPIIYDENPAAVPTKITIHGADDADLAYIKKQFSAISGKALTQETYKTFSGKIYKTGKYTSVTMRLTDNGHYLDVIVKKKKKEKNLLLFGAAYKGTLASDACNDITLYSDFQFRNITGTDSVLSIRAATLTDFQFELMYMQPFGENAYMKLDLLTMNDRTIVSSGFDHYPIDATQLKQETAKLTFGLPITQWLTFLTGAGINHFNTTEVIEYGTKTNTTDYFASFAINSLNYKSFPSSGLFLSLKETGIIPLQNLDESHLYNVGQLDMTIAIPCTKKISLVLGGFSGTNFTEDMKDIQELKPVYGFGLADRRFFPQVCTSTEYGLHKAAAEASIQFSPWDQLTILGGKAFFALTGAAGNVWSRYENIGKDDLCWRASADAGIRLTDAFGFLLRIGAGKSRGTTMPFISLDIGNVHL